MSRLLLLASYPKSGNTWLRAALLSLIAGGQPIPLDALAGIPNAAARLLFDDGFGLDTGDLTPAELARLRPLLYDHMAQSGESRWILLKVHDALLGPGPDLPPPFAPASLGAVIYLVRDPRDVAVSLAAHRGEPIDQIIDRMGNPAETRPSPDAPPGLQVPQFMSSWSAHVESWLAAPVHLLRYEDMALSPCETLAALARFMGLPRDSAAIAAAVAASRFEVLQAQEEQSGFRERPAGMARFFRRGIVGGWRDSLRPEAASRLIADHGAVMRRLGYALD